MPHPVLQRGHSVGAVRFRQGFHYSTIRVSTHDYERHVKGEHRVLYAGGNSADMFAVSGNDVAWRSLGKNLSRPGLRQHVGKDARIGASEEHGNRRLAVPEIFKEFALSG